MNICAISLVISVLLCATAQADIVTGLVGHWPLNEGSGPTAADSAGANAGTLTNTESTDWVAGKLGFALQLDGVNEYVTMGDVLDFDAANPFSLALWFKADIADYTANICLLCKKQGATPFTGYGITIRGTTAGDPWRFALTNNGGSTELAVNYPRPADLLWHHLVCTYNGTSLAAGLVCYVDNAVSTPSIQLNTLSGTTLTGVPLQIGAQDSTLFFTGQIDDVRIYTRVLSATDVTELYALGTRRQGLMVRP